MFLVYKKTVQIFTNLIPINLSGGINLEITPQDFWTNTSKNTLKTTENKAEHKEKDSLTPSLIVKNEKRKMKSEEYKKISPIARIFLAGETGTHPYSNKRET